MISFVVPAYNEERELGRTLRSLHTAAQAVDAPYEIIVADDDSSDRTADIAESEGARLVRVAHRQISATRNSGARQARGDLFIFVDADTRVGGVVVRAAVEALDAGAVGGGAAVEFDEPMPGWARRVLPFFIRLYHAAGLAAGCFLFCTREAFDTAGGFDEALYASEEVAFSMALKRQGRFVVLPQAVTTSSRKMRMYSGRQLLRVLGGLLLRGRRSVEDRKHLGLWYEDRREDPELET